MCLKAFSLSHPFKFITWELLGVSYSGLAAGREGRGEWGTNWVKGFRRQARWHLIKLHILPDVTWANCRTIQQLHWAFLPTYTKDRTAGAKLPLAFLDWLSIQHLQEICPRSSAPSAPGSSGGLRLATGFFHQNTQDDSMTGLSLSLSLIYTALFSLPI